MRAFLSYSHKDKWALERLHIHLAVLRREGKITEWFDREILAGGEVDKEISAQLEECDVFLPLVSADFLASNYCYEKEMGRAIRRHKDGAMRIVPVIVEPCDWKSSPLLPFKALPRDGKPITEWTNQNNAFLDIVEELRRLIKPKPVDTAHKDSTQINTAPSTRGRKYRQKRDFDVIDKSEFQRAAFETMRNCFQAFVAEINGIDGMKARLEGIGSQGFTCTVLNLAIERGIAHITVHAQSGGIGLGDIYYSFSENAPTNTANGGFNIVSDEYGLFLQAFTFARPDTDEKLSPQSAAEGLWIEFLQQAGISYD